MNDLASAAAGSSLAAEPIGMAERRSILVYSSVMILVIAFISPTGLTVVPWSFILKNKLHFSANGQATFGLLAGFPWYVSFVFGVIRDYWNPFGLGDRGYFIVFGAVAALLLCGFAFAGVSVAMLFAATVLSGIAFILLFAAWNGLGSSLGVQHAMSGQMSAAWNIAGTIALVAGLAAGGVMSDWLEGFSAAGAVRTLFLVTAAFMALIAVLGLWRPRAVFANLRRERGPQHRNLGAELLRFVRHRPIYPALLILLLWNFSPATQTVLQYYLSNTLHAKDTQWGDYNAISTLSFVPAYVLFGFLSPRVSLKSLLWWGTLVGIPQVVPLLFVHTANGILFTAVLIGLLGGVCTAAYFDLLIRSCPRGLEGTLMMMSWSFYALAGNLGNWWGTELYEHGGFTACVVATTIVYALILPALLLIPNRLIASADGEVVPPPPCGEVKPS